MKKIIFMLMAFVLILTACSSDSEPIIDQPEINEPGSNGPSEPVVSEPEKEEPGIDYEYYENLKNHPVADESDYDLPSSYDDMLCFTFEVPDLTGMDKSELPYLDENPEWCIYGTDWVQLDEELFGQVLFEDNKEAEALAKSVALLSPHHGIFSSYYSSQPFNSITNANEKELLWAAICQTPEKKLSENENHAFNFVENYINELSEGSYVVLEIYSEEDVEKTFRWLFGEKANFVPQNIEMFGIRYFEELGAFVQFFDGIMMFPAFPQIVSFSVNNGVYTVEVIGASSNPNGEIYFKVLLEDQTVKELPLNKENVKFISELISPAVYTFEKAEDGHFVLTGHHY